MKAGSMASLLTLKVYRMVRGDGVGGLQSAAELPPRLRDCLKRNLP